VEPRVRRVVAERLAVDPAELAPEVSLTDELAADSLDLVDLVSGLEEEFGIAVPESTIDELRTYRQLVDVAEAHTRERRAKEAWAESQRTPPLIWARVLPPASQPSGSLERAGWFTPYTAETIVDSALRAGAGARLDMHVPPNLGEPVLAELRAEFGWLRLRHIAVHIRRDPRLPPLGVAPVSSGAQSAA
jgi:acyl carrier protein